MLAFAPSPHDIAWLLLLYLLFPITWIIGLIRFRRRGRHMALWTALIALIYLARLFALPFAADHLGRYQLTVTICDEQGRPLPFLPVRYQTEPALSGLGRYANQKEGSGTTDASGRISIPAHHPPTTRLIVTRPGFPENSLYLIVS